MLGDLNDPDTGFPNMTLATGESRSFPGMTLGVRINNSGETNYLKNGAGSIVDTWSKYACTFDVLTTVCGDLFVADGRGHW